MESSVFSFYKTLICGGDPMTNICPICQTDNNCRVDEPYDCWCMSIQLAKDSLEEVEQKDIANMCICLKCLQNIVDHKLIHRK